MQPYSSTTNNPFLCNDCQKLGYCRKSREAAIAEMLPKYYEVLSKPNPQYHYMKDTDIANLVPIKTMVRDSHTNTGKKLQKAHDLFHQYEYEQASYLYRDLLTHRADYQEAALGLAVCYYFMKEYEEAAVTVSYVDSVSLRKSIPEFLNACERVLKSEIENKTAVESINKNSKPLHVIKDVCGIE
jgi:hypothetical protein